MVDNKIRSLLRGSGIIFVGFILDVCFRYLTTIILARWAGPSNFGILELGHTLALFITTFGIIGLDSGISRYLPRMEGKDEKRRVVTTALVLAIPSLLLIVFGMTHFNKPLVSLLGAQDHREIITVFIFVIPFLGLTNLLLAVMRGEEYSIPEVITKKILIPGSRLFIIIVVTLLGGSLIHLSYSYIVSYTLGFTIAFYYVVKSYGFGVSKLSKTIPKELLLFSAPVVIAGIMYSVLSWIDVFLLGYILQDSSEIGIYRAIYPLARLLLIILVSFNFLVMPIASELDSEGDKRGISQIYSLVSKLVLVFSLPVFLIIFMYPNILIHISYGPEYLSGETALQILSVGFLIQAVAGPNGNTLKSIGHTKSLMGINIGAAVMNIVSNIILIPGYKIVGAAIATTISFVWMNIAMNYMLYRSHGINVVGVKKISGILLAIFVFKLSQLVFEMLFQDFVWQLVFLIIVFLPSYMMIASQFILTRNEQNNLREIINSVLPS